MASEGVRGIYAKTPARRRKILSAAVGVFAESGYRKGSLREIAERVGMSQAGLLHHFSNKHLLLSEVLSMRDDLSAQHFEGDLETISGLEFLRGYVRLIDANEIARGLVELYCVVSAEATASDHPAHDYFVERYQYVLGKLESAFADLQADGQLRPGLTPRDAASALAALTDGMQLQWLLLPDSGGMGDSVRRYLNAVTTLTF